MSMEKLNGNNHHSSNQKSSRLCYIKKIEHFDGYGFNLHAEKGKPGQYIGKVDDGSPAEAAGLRQGDRILEVNGESIGDKTHKQVVELIKQNTNETQLLVIDPDDGTSIIPIITSINNHHHINTENLKNNSTNNSSESSPTSPTSNGKHVVVVVADNNSENRNNIVTTTTTTTTTTTSTSTINKKSESENVTLNLSMTAAELRAKLAAKKKFDPKKEAMDFKQKFDIVQKL